MTATAIATATADAVPVAPGRLPVIGHALAFRKDPIGFLTSLSEIGELVKVYLGPVQTFVVTSPRLAHQMLVTDSAGYDKGRLFDMLRRTVGNGLLTSEGAFNRRQRRLMQPGFSSKRIADYVGIMRRRTEDMMAGWQSGDVIDVQRMTDELSLGIGVETLFNTDLCATAVDTVRECLPIILKGVVARTVLPDVVCKLPVPALRRITRAEQRIRDAIGTIIEAYRADDTDRGDMLTALLAARDENGQGMTDEQVRDELVTLVLAAAETTSSVLASVFYRISENPEVDRKVAAEIDGHLAGRPIEYDDMKKLPYTLNMLSEVLRLDIPADWFSRRTTKEMVLGETELPARTELMYSIPALHRNPEVYPDPERFDPDRWVSRPARDLPKGSYIPFGSGSRICIGNAFAWSELTTVTATVLSKWKLTVAPGAKPERLHRITTHFADLPMTITAR
ncbi:cytochrome P450 [Lentzea sp. NPDC051213]|uniref:cytochrome P450 n=1 Tax=Lentzea sp. NPDC051213 TaxID=3364126 RepID=UPI0037BB4019